MRDNICRSKNKGKLIISFDTKEDKRNTTIVRAAIGPFLTIIGGDIDNCGKDFSRY